MRMALLRDHDTGITEEGIARLDLDDLAQLLVPRLPDIPRQPDIDVRMLAPDLLGLAAIFGVADDVVAQRAQMADVAIAAGHIFPNAAQARAIHDFDLD